MSLAESLDSAQMMVSTALDDAKEMLSEVNSWPLSYSSREVYAATRTFLSVMEQAEKVLAEVRRNYERD